MDNGTVFLPNDCYLLENEKFRLSIPHNAMKHRISSWSWRITSATPLKWSLISTTPTHQKQKVTVCQPSVRPLPNKSVNEIHDVVTALFPFVRLHFVGTGI